MSIEKLSFQEFQERYEAAFPNSDPPASKGERYSLYAVLVGIIVVLAAALAAIDTTAGQIIILLGFTIEIGGVVAYGVFGFIQIKQDIKFDDRSGAQELDRDFLGYQQIVSWLRGFSHDDLESRLVFASSRTDSWQRGSSLVMGGIEKLGFLPVIVALYLQFKDTSWSWPPEITVVGALFAFLIIAIYVVGMWAVTRRLQVARFERLLKVALDPSFKVAELAAPEGSDNPSA
jgi:hypothetical protein